MVHGTPEGVVVVGKEKKKKVCRRRVRVSSNAYGVLGRVGKREYNTLSHLAGI